MASEDRPSWDNYFMSIAEQVGSRSTCTRRKIGALIVRDKRILATGYNNVPSGIEHCTTKGCLRDELGIPSGERHELCRGIHAEQNAVVQAAKYGIAIDGSSMYTTTQPCILCGKIMINAGIKEIVFVGEYPDDLSRTMLEEAGVALRQVSLSTQASAAAEPPQPQDDCCCA
ncbi:MAG: cytidine/deoxycytidylate deaminase family protein [Coriobacteriia bacterium]|nr:cytidine/deoxycytidylate deaminase family protein [Coriobacteriia bacterium]MCL2537061.1 cytidine/deoxycytidylate deaminase family protein [Coriobacteriia bacterium]